MIRRLAFLIVLAASPLAAQSPAEDWRTITTAHFRVHTPRRSEAWAARAADALERAREAVVKEVGFAPEPITDVVVSNPVSYANGITLTLLDTPRIVLYTEPPEPESAIGEFHDWIELLTVHEMTHLVHLLRPSRNPMERLAERLLPLNPIALGAPRWVLEGYATLVEGRITASGRPNGALRTAVLRKLAVSGRLPTYGELDSSRRFLGMSYAYLAGSAFLEWLEPRGGPDALQHLWRRMTARHRRSFDEAFIGVFGESPSRLYGKFTAELTANARELPDAALWQETTYESGDPAVSPDGSKLAMVLRDDKQEGKLVVFSTGPNEAEKKLDERIAKILKRDPEDVAPVRTKPVPREPLQTLRPAAGGDMESPRWSRDGKSILYTYRQPDRDGFLHRDLFRWTPESGRVERLTHLADVHDADPIDDDHAVAVRNRDGQSQLVTVNLSTGEVTPRGEATFDVFSHPRAHGAQLAWAQHDGAWKVMLDGRPISPRGAFSPEWSGDRVLSVFSSKDFIDIAQLENSEAKLIARSSGALADPAPAPDGSLYFMSLEPDGFVVRKLASGEQRAAGALEPAPSPPARSPLAAPRSPSKPYGIGRQELAGVFGGTYATDLRATEFGLRAGDVVGRLDTLLLGSLGDVRGAALATRWRGWPVHAALHLFSAESQHGAELRGSYSLHAPLSVFTIDGGALAGGSSRAFIDTSFRLRQHDSSEELRVAGDSRRHIRGSLRAAARLGDNIAALTLTAAHRDVALGGLPSSIIPDSLNIPRVFDPALPPSRRVASSYRGARAELTSSGVTLFFQHHRLGGETLRVAGAAVVLRHAAEPLVKAPALDLTAGVARVIDEHRNRAWVGVRWRP